MLDAHFNILLSSNRRETATSRCPTRRPRRCPRRSRCCCRSCWILVRLGSSSLLLRVWHGLLTLVHRFGFLCFFLLLGGVVVHRCLQIAGTELCGRSCPCTPLVGRDSLGLVVHSRRRRRRAELPVAVGVGLAKLALHRACAWLTSAARFVSARVGPTEGRPGRVKSGHLAELPTWRPTGPRFGRGLPQLTG